MCPELIAQQCTRFYQLAGEDAHTKLWLMLEKGRLDALIDYSAHSTVLAEHQAAFRTSAIRGEPALIAGYLVCNRSQQGQQLLSLFDTLLQQPALQQLWVSYQQDFSAKEWQQLQDDLQQLLPAPF